MKAGKVVAVVVLVLITCLLALCAVGLIVFPSRTASLVAPVFPEIAQAIDPTRTEQAKGGAEEGASSSSATTDLIATHDADLSTAQEEEEYRQTHKGRPAVYPLVAQCSGVDIRCPIAPADLTGVLFHQASYPYALGLTTELPSANIEDVSPETPARVNHEQLDGEWLDCDAMHIWRTSDATDMDTSIDIGAAAGTPLRSPVTGTVVLVKNYRLYEEIDDIEIHIQPEGRADLDVVVIHTQDPLVRAGDRVEAGVTELSHVRDIASLLTDVQLGFYTGGDDPGNHTHVQVNDAEYKDYREKKLEGAIRV